MEMEKDLRLYYELVERMVVMKKKLFAVIAAAMTGLCCLAAPVSAEQTCKMGDVNMDGEIDLGDAQLALREFTYHTLGQKKDKWLSDEQIQLAMIVESKYRNANAMDCVDLQDAWFILKYYTVGMGEAQEPDTDIVAWCSQLIEARRPAK